MRKILSLLMGAALLVAVQAVRADDMAKAEGVSTPVAGSTGSPQASSTPAAKAKVKKAKKKTTKAAAKEVWICAMGDYSGPKTADGKCPKCGMDLMKQK